MHPCMCANESVYVLEMQDAVQDFTCWGVVEDFTSCFMSKSRPGQAGKHGLLLAWTFIIWCSSFVVTSLEEHKAVYVTIALQRNFSVW